MVVVSIGNSAFENKGSITAIAIPGSVTSVGQFAFYLCSGLTSITLMDGLISIGTGAFMNCTGLTFVHIAGSVANIGAGTFMNCSHLASAYFYGNAPVMDGYVFSNCASGFTVYYLAGATGFTNPWYGNPTAVFDPATITTTTISIPPSTTSTIPPTTTTTALITTTSLAPVTTRTCMMPNTTKTSQPTTTTVPVDIDNDEDGKFDYIQAGCSNLDGDCDYNDAAADGNQIAMMNNDGTSTFLKTYADVSFNAVTPAFHPARTETRNYCANLTWAGIDSWQPLDESDIWKLASANHPFDSTCNSYDWGCDIFSTSWSSKTAWGAPPAPWNTKLSLQMYNNNHYRSWLIVANGCSSDDSWWFRINESDVYSYSKFETDTRWPNARPMVICKAAVTTTTSTVPLDADGDGIPDASDNCPAVANPQQGDADTDGIGDVCDTAPGCGGGCGQPVCEQEVDTDGDFYADANDTCPAACNFDQLDADGDGIGDVCDADPGCGGEGQPVCETSCDTDNDGIFNYLDNCPNTANPQQLDADTDGIGDVCDPSPGCGGGCGQPVCENQVDSDGDNFADHADNCPALCNRYQMDADSDGAGDVCDADPGCGGGGQPVCEAVCAL